MRKIVIALLAVALLMAAVPLLAQGSTEPGIAANRPVLTAVGRPGSVQLEWTEPDHAGIVGYQIRRGSAPGEEDRWPLQDFPVQGTTFLDTTATPGTTYYYEVLPVLRSGKLGLPSYEVATQAEAVPDGYRLIQLRIDSGEVTVLTAAGEERVTLTAEPFIYHGRVMLALDDLVSLLGADITYAADTGTITHRLPCGRVMQMALGKKGVDFGKATRQDVVAPMQQNGVIYLPLRWVAEAMECQLSFSMTGHTVLIEIQK